MAKSSEVPEGWKVHMDDGKSICYGKEEFFTKEESDVYFRRIKADGDGVFAREKIKLFGRICEMKRMTTYYGNPGTRFRYSGQIGIPNDWTDTMLEIRNRINDKLNTKLNFCVASVYKDGNDNIGWHGDKLRDMEQNIIVSVNFGATREFHIKPRKTPINGKEVSKLYKENSGRRSNCTIKIPLSHGDVAVMDGDMQSTWLHSVPKRKYVDSIHVDGYGSTIERINITFRVIKVRKQED